MAIKVSQAFQRTSANAIDESLTLTKAQMLTVNDNLMPAYYFTICQDDGEIYLYDKSATASASTGKFKKFEGGGGGGGGTGVIIDATLTAAGWNTTTNQQTVTFTGYDASMGGVIGMPTSATAAQKEAYAAAMINVVSQSGAAFTFECANIPSIDLPVTLYAGGGSGGGGADLPSGGTIGQALVKKSATDGDVEWKDVVGQFSTFPSPSATYADKIIQYTGATNGSKKNGHFYTCVSDGSDYRWVEIDVQTIESIQYSTMPTPEGSLVGKIVQYVGETTITAPIYVNGLFYKCIMKSSSPLVYEWVQTDVQSYPEADLTNVFSSGMPVASISGDRRFNYQTDEHEIGTWIDGSPLYQKTYSLSMVTNGGNIASIDISGTYQLRFIHTCLCYDGNSIQESTFYWAADNYWVVWIENGYIKGKANQSSYGGKPIYITLQYTKNS